MKTLMGLAGLTMAGFMLLSCNTEVKEAKLSDNSVTAGNFGNGSGCSVHFVKWN